MRDLVMVLVAATAVSATARAQDCNRPAPSAVTYVSVPGHPFSAIPSADGCWMFVSLASDKGSPSGVAVLQRQAGRVALVRLVQTRAQPTGMEMAHDGRVLIAAQGDGIAVLDEPAMISGRGNPILGYVDYGAKLPPVTAETRRFVASQMGVQAAGRLKPPGSVYVGVTPDDRYVFVADEWLQSISVIDLRRARRSNFAGDAVIGRIPTGVAPVGLAFSPDGRFLYATTEGAAERDGRPAVCRPEGHDPLAQAPNPEGEVVVIDVAVAESRPGDAVVARVPGGCTPVRVVLSPSGDTAYVTARRSDAVLVFDTQKLVGDPARARIATVPVGTAPVGIAILDGGRRLAVTDSNRFSANGTDETLTVIDTARVAGGANAVVGTIPTRGFPRELRVTADGRTLLVTNFVSDAVELIDLARVGVGAGIAP